MALEDPKILGSWVQEKILGTGGFGIVSLWKNKDTGHMIAIKKCRPGIDNLLTPIYKTRWSKEVEMMGRLAHPNIVASLNLPEPLKQLKSELPILCMEFCAKGDMRHVINKPENSCGLKECDVRDFIFDIKSAIQYLHSMKITHRDLKPENIVLKQTDNRIIYKLIDLGYAKELDASSICNSFVGTLQYLAPELFLGKSYTSCVDYWSLGLVSFEIITGNRPFLPHLDTALWMSHVRIKTSDDICVYQALDDKIIYQQEIFEENFISPTLKYHLENWFKNILEWDPVKRGRDIETNKIIVFDKIDEILSKKIISIFSMTSYVFLSYEIDESTQISTLQKWIERDTNLKIAHQELLKPDGISLDIEIPVLQSFQHLKLGDLHLFVFDKFSLVMPKVPPKIPLLVTKMMEDPKMMLPQYHLKRIWAQSVYYLKQEMELYRTFLLGHQAKRLNIFKKNSTLQMNWVNLNTNIEQLDEVLKFYQDSEKFDQEQAVKFNIANQEIFNTWSKKVTQETNNIKVLKDLLAKLKQKCDSVALKIMDLHKSPYIMMKDQDILRGFYEKGLQLLEKLKLIFKDNKSLKRNSTEMAHIIYNCFKHRDQLLHDESFASQLQKLIHIQNDIEKISIPIFTAVDHIKEFKSHIKNAQLERQNQIWNLVKTSKTSLNQNTLEVNANSTRRYSDTPISQSKPNSEKPFRSLSPNILQNNNNKTLLSLKISPNLMHSENFNSTNIITQNKEYRHKIEESIEKARRIQSYICKDETFAWECLIKND